MPIPQIENGEDGLSVRNKLNSLFSAADSTASAITARMDAIRSLPSDFEQDDAYWTSNLEGSPDERLYSNPPDGTFVDTSEGRAFSLDVTTSTGHLSISPRAVLSSASGRTFRVSIKYRYVGGTGAPSGSSVYNTARRLDSDFNNVEQFSGDFLSFDAGDGVWATEEFEFVIPDDWVHVVFFVNRPGARTYDGEIQFTDYIVEDISAELEAQEAADAAATSADAAATSADDAGTSASAAAISETNAGESATEANTSALNAAASAQASGNSASAAAVSADAASTSETNAATWAAAAATSETNAGTSASAAATSETNAGNSAAAAATSETNAGISASNAGNSASNAATSETNAGNSAGAAATSASNAATSETNAATSETNAATSETNAGNSASSAATSADAAATSASNAATSETNAALSEEETAGSAAEARLDAIGGLPSDFEQDDAYWTRLTSGSPESRLYGFDPHGTFVDTTEGRAFSFEMLYGAYRYLSQRGVLSDASGKTFTNTIKYRYVGGTVEPAVADVYVTARRLDSDFNNVEQLSGLNLTFSGGDGVWTTDTFDMVIPSDWVNVIFLVVKRNNAAFDGEIEIVSDRVDELYSYEALLPNTKDFDTRPALVTANSTTTWASGDVVSDGTVQYVYDGITDELPGLSGFKPFGVTRPDHFAENNGSNDMGIAANDAIAYEASVVGSGIGAGQAASIVVEWLPVDYPSSTPIAWDGSFDGVKLYGNGARIVTSMIDPVFQVGDPVVFSNGDTASAVSTYDCLITGFILMQDNKSSASVAIRAGRCPNLRIEKNWIIDFGTSLDFQRVSNCHVIGNFIHTISRTTGGQFGVVQGVYDSSNVYTPGGGIHVHDNEFLGHPTDWTMIGPLTIKSCDGFYYGNNHFVYCNGALELAPEGSANNYRNNVIIEILSEGGNYFDAQGAGSTNIVVGGTIAYAGTSGQQNGAYGTIRFGGNDKIRGSGTADYGVLVQVTDEGGFMAGRGGIKGLSIDGADIASHVVTSVVIQGSPHGMVDIVAPMVTGNLFQKGRRNGTSSGTSYIDIESDGSTVSGNTITAEDVAPARAVLVTPVPGGEYSHVMTDNNLSGTIATVEPYTLTTTNAVNMSVRNNVVPASGISIEEVVTGLSSGYASQEVWGKVLSVNESTGRLRADVSGISNDGDNESIEVSVDIKAVRDSSGSVTTSFSTEAIGQNTLTGNEYPVVATMRTGPAWVNNMTLAIGDVVLNGGNVYLIIASDGTGGTTGPTHTNGAQMLSGVRYLYLGSNAPTKLVLMVSGSELRDIKWTADINYRETN